MKRAIIVWGGWIVIFALAAALGTGCAVTKIAVRIERGAVEIFTTIEGE